MVGRASWTLGTMEPEVPGECGVQPSHRTERETEAQGGLRTCPEPSCPLTASSLLQNWAVSFHAPSGTAPTAAWLRPSSGPCAGSSRLGGAWGFLWSSGS